MTNFDRTPECIDKCERLVFSERVLDINGVDGLYFRDEAGEYVDGSKVPCERFCLQLATNGILSLTNALQGLSQGGVDGVNPAN